MSHQDQAKVSLEAFIAFSEQFGQDQFGQMVMEIVLEELMSGNYNKETSSNESPKESQ
jgi:hypothetical protein